jgi:hypothetical protein
VENREEPGFQICAPLEAVLESERFDIRVLHQVLGVGRPAGQPHGGAIQGIDVRERLVREGTRRVVSISAGVRVCRRLFPKQHD